MAGKSYISRNAFNSGEVSPLVSMRDDVAKLSSACLTLENAVPLVEGGAKKMPGTYFAGGTALGGAMFTGYIFGTTLTVTVLNYGVLRIGQTITGANVIPGTTISALGSAIGGTGTYTLSASQTVGSETMQTVSSGKSRLVPFQFSTIQGAVLEFSDGVTRVWQGANQGVWFLGILSQEAGEPAYDPTHAYTAGNVVVIGPTFFISSSTGTPAGSLAISAPYGTVFSNAVLITFSVNGSDALAVTATGSSPNQGINIALASTTASLNTAVLIQAAIRALVSLNVAAYNFVDLTGWTVTPDPTYYATPWITAPVSA